MVENRISDKLLMNKQKMFMFNIFNRPNIISKENTILFHIFILILYNT